MPRLVSYDRIRLDWLELRPNPDGTWELRFAASQGHASGHEQAREHSGWEGTTPTQRQALRTAVVAVLKARIAEILGTDPATHDLAVSGGEFVEQPKP